ncbi:fimbria/pilus periplasmic chaperone [Citrobacter werkmanii]|nr:fimbria/pilus periplasmic chaperone [Citrobacter werkmanii]
MKNSKLLNKYLLSVLLLAVPLASHSAIMPDRTRVIFNGNDKSVTITLKNSNATLPYLAQVWIEDEKYAKDTTHLAALPPLQRIEPKSDGQIKIQPLQGITSLPQDRESLFYFNVREIPPKSDKPNTLQLALQTRIKLFYRPLAVANQVDKQHLWQTQLRLTYQGDSVVFDNPTPFYVVISNAGNKEGNTAAGFKNMLLAPHEKATVAIKSSALGSTPVVNYVDDFGGHRLLLLTCSGNSCRVDEEKTREAEKKANK